MDHDPPEPQESPARIPPAGPPRTAIGADTLPPGRRYLVVREEALIGRSRLEYPLPHDRSAAGRFFPEGPFDALRETFRLGRRALARNDPDLLRRYVEERDALGLKIRDQNGTEMDGRVDLISEWEDGTLIVHATLPDPLYWERVEAGDA